MEWDPKVADLNSLLEQQDSGFVVTAYSVLLGRLPDPSGLQHYLGLLRRGVPKIQILREISNSPEALTTQGELPGLRKAARRLLISRIPVIGAIIRLFIDIDGYSPMERRLRVLEQHLFLSDRQLDSRLLKLESSVDRLAQAIEGLSRANGVNVILSGEEAEEIDHLTADERAIYAQLKDSLRNHLRTTPR